MRERLTLSKAKRIVCVERDVVYDEPDALVNAREFAATRDPGEPGHASMGRLYAAERLRAFYTLRHLEPVATAPHYVWRPVWRMNYVENPGAAWGIFRGFSEGFRTVFFGLVSIAAVAFILNYYRKLREEQRFLQLALAFVLAGAVGNFLDRLARGYVIDFVEWYWWNRPDLRWPTFNVADSLIVVGVTMLILHPGSSREKARGGSRAAKEAGPA
jgi:signal peptidase II